MPSIVTFIGWHNSGKTTLVSKVVHHLKELGYRVAVIKSSKEVGIEFDKPETDTAKHKEAGADSVLFVAPDQMVLQTSNNNLSITTLAHRYFQEADIVIGEGFKNAKQVAKIEVFRNPEHQLRQKVRGVIAIASDLDLTGDHVFRLNESRQIAAFIEKRFLQNKKQGAAVTSLLVNGKKIGLQEFIQQSLAGTVNGYIKSLKMVDDVREIDLRITLNKINSKQQNYWS